MQIRCSVLLLCICKHNTLVCRPNKVHMQYQLIYGKLSSITEGNTFVVMLKLSVCEKSGPTSSQYRQGSNRPSAVDNFH